MPNQYNRPVSSGFRNTYVSQFVPLPLEQFARTNELNQAKQDKEVADLNNVSDAAWKINGVADEDNKYVASIRGAFDDAATKLSTQDLTQRENIDAARGLVKNISRDKNLATIMSNAAKVKEYQEAKQKMTENGTYAPYNDEFLGSYADYQKSGGYKSGKNLSTTIHKYENVRPVQEEFVNNMGENGADIIKSIGETYYQDGYKGISKNQAYGRVQQAFGSYMGTNAAAQEARRYDSMVRNGQLDPKKMDKQEFLFKGLLDAGLERVHGVSNSGLAAAMNADKKAKKEQEDSLLGGILSTEIPSTLTNGRKIEFDDKGEIKGSGKGLFATLAATPAKDVVKGFKDWYNNHDTNDEEAKDYAHIITGARLSGVSPQQYAEKFDKTTHMKVDHPLVGKELRDINEAVFNGSAGIWNDLSVMSITTGERNKNLVEALEAQGLKVPDPSKKPEEFKKFLKDNVSITGAANPNEFSARPIIFTVGNKEFAADMTYDGKSNPFGNGDKANQKYAEAQRLQRFDKLMKGQIVEGEHDGKQGVFFRNMSKLDDRGEPIIDFKAK